MNSKSEVDIGPIVKCDLLVHYKMSHVLRTLHMSSGEKHYKVRYCVTKDDEKKKRMLTVTALNNGTTFRETLNELIKLAEIDDSHHFPQCSAAFIIRHYLFVETPLAFDLEQIIRVRKRSRNEAGNELNEPVISEDVIGHILRRILKALAHLHRFALHNNVVTRSVFITESAEVKLGGFKWVITEADDYRKSIELHGNRFFGCPRQWAPEEALQDVDHYGSSTELWHVGLLIPEMVTGDTFHLSDKTEPHAIAEAAVKLLSSGSPIPWDSWFPAEATYAMSTELQKLWTDVMQPDYSRRPTIGKLLDKVSYPIIQAVSKERLYKELLMRMKTYRLPPQDEKGPLASWRQLRNFSRECGTGDLSNLQPLYFGMGRKEMFSPLYVSNKITKEQPENGPELDFRKIPADILFSVHVIIARNGVKIASQTFPLHFDMLSASINSTICRHLYKFVKERFFGLANYIRICTEMIAVIRDRNRIREQHRCWRMALEEDHFNTKNETCAVVKIVFNGFRAKYILENVKEQDIDVSEKCINMPDSLTLETYYDICESEDQLRDDAESEASREEKFGCELNDGHFRSV